MITELLKAFLVGGIICGVGQLLIDYTKLTPARILTGFVVSGVILSALGLYKPLAENDEEKINDSLFYRDVNYVIYIPENYREDFLNDKNPEIEIKKVDNYEEFKKEIEKGGFILAHWDGTAETEAKIKEDTKATIRCIPFDTYLDDDKEAGKCMVTGKPSACRVLFARAY